MENQRVVDLMRVVKVMDFTSVITEVERRKEIHGHTHFEDITESLKMIVNPVKFPHLFEACKRFLETIIIVTLHPAEDVTAGAW